MSATASLILSLVLAVPVGLLTNLLTPSFIRLASHLNGRVRERQKRRHEVDQALALWLSSNPTALTETLAHFRLEIAQETLMTVLAGILSFVITMTIDLKLRLFGGGWSVQLVAAASILLMGHSAYRSLGTLRRYRALRLQIYRHLGWPTPDGRVWSQTSGSWQPLETVAQQSLPAQQHGHDESDDDTDFSGTNLV